MRGFVREWVRAVRSIPDLWAAAIDRWLLDAHGPVDVFDDGRTLVCRMCRGNPPWPCEHYVKATDRLADRTDP